MLIKFKLCTKGDKCFCGYQLAFLANRFITFQFDFGNKKIILLHLKSCILAELWNHCWRQEALYFWLVWSSIYGKGKYTMLFTENITPTMSISPLLGGGGRGLRFTTVLLTSKQHHQSYYVFPLKENVQARILGYSGGVLKPCNCVRLQFGMCWSYDIISCTSCSHFHVAVNTILQFHWSFSVCGAIPNIQACVTRLLSSQKRGVWPQDKMVCKQMSPTAKLIAICICV